MQAVGLANYLPLTNVGEGTTFEIEGRSYARPDEKPSSWRSVVGGRYFETMGIPLVRGRLPGLADTDRTQHVAVIDEVVARRYWPNADPIGARLLFKNPDEGTTAAVVIGIVGNVRWMATAAEPPRFAHIPLILNHDGSKMSKRDLGARLGSYIDEGFLPEAVRNYLCLLGWSPKDDRE